MLEKWNKCVRKGKVFGALLTELSKAFDCLNHKLLIAKLNAYSFNLPALRLIMKTNNKNKNTSILRPLSFNIFLTDLLFSNIDIASHVDVNTPYIAADNIDDLVKSLEEASTTLFQWFDHNLLKNNPGECHLQISSNENITVKIGEYEIENEYEKLLRFS